MRRRPEGQRLPGEATSFHSRGRNSHVASTPARTWFMPRSLLHRSTGTYVPTHKASLKPVIFPPHVHIQPSWILLLLPVHVRRKPCWDQHYFWNKSASSPALYWHATKTSSTKALIMFYQPTQGPVGTTFVSVSHPPSSSSSPNKAQLKQALLDLIPHLWLYPLICTVPLCHSYQTLFEPCLFRPSN